MIVMKAIATIVQLEGRKPFGRPLTTEMLLDLEQQLDRGDAVATRLQDLDDVSGSMIGWFTEWNQGSHGSKPEGEQEFTHRIVTQAGAWLMACVDETKSYPIPKMSWPEKLEWLQGVAGSVDGLVNRVRLLTTANDILEARVRAREEECVNLALTICSLKADIEDIMEARS
jgi:hypothetical protein